MKIFSWNSKIELNNIISNRNKKQISIKLPDLKSDSFAKAQEQVQKQQQGIFDKLRKIFHIRRRNNSLKINAAQVKRVLNKSEEYLKQAQKLVKNEMCGIENKNTDVYRLEYQGDKYVSITTINKDGFIDKIIHAKNGEVEAIYDIKTPVPPIKPENMDDLLSADCYFYKKITDPPLMKREYRQNITNKASKFHSVYNPVHGGVNKVKENIDNSPVEVCMKDKGDRAILFFFNYSSK